LVYTRVWRPSKGTKVDLQEIEDTLAELHVRFCFRALYYDPWQATHMASRLQSGGLGRMIERRADRKASLPMIELPATGQNLQRIASAVIEAFNDGRIELYHEPDLRRDLTRLRVEERPYGFRLTSPRDATGHGDLGTAFSLGLLGASELAAKRRSPAGSAAVGPLDMGAPLSGMDRHMLNLRKLEQAINARRQQPPETAGDVFLRELRRRYPARFR